MGDDAKNRHGAGEGDAREEVERLEEDPPGGSRTGRAGRGSRALSRPEFLIEVEAIANVGRPGIRRDRVAAPHYATAEGSTGNKWA
jgi:hypothetical protein